MALNDRWVSELVLDFDKNLLETTVATLERFHSRLALRRPPQ